MNDYAKVICGIADTLHKAGATLSDDQRMLLAGCLSVWVDKLVSDAIKAQPINEAHIKHFQDRIDYLEESEREWRARAEIWPIGEYERGLSDAAKLIEQHQIADNGSAGKYLRPRLEGSIDGLFYAQAIRMIPVQREQE